MGQEFILLSIYYFQDSKPPSEREVFWGCKIETFSLGRKALNPLSCGSGFCDCEERKVTNFFVNQTGWKVWPERVKAP